jgi:hypothetical protein
MTIWPTEKLGEICEKDVKDRVLIAIDTLLVNDVFLLKNDVHERSVAHKLAEYLQQQFSGWNVDCEYNLHGIDTKILPRECDNHYREYVYPDIIIHHRGYDSNMLVIEIKLRRSESVDACDNAKLVEFTKKSGDYKYRLGLFIGFDGLDEPQISWYEDGQQKD